MQPWIDPVTRHKIKLIGGESKLHQALEHEGIKLDQLPSNVGGTNAGITVFEVLNTLIAESQAQKSTTP